MQYDPTLIKKGLSVERLDTYRARGKCPNNDEAVFSYYLWNLTLCEAFYPCLQGLEITLRNNINDVLSKASGERWFEDARVLHLREQEDINRAKQRLAEQGRPHDPGRVISELSLGFWTSLLDRRYEQVLWPRFIKAVFPGMPKKIRSRVNVARRMEGIRRLRNRVFHHEPICFLTDLPQQHENILDAISWINPAVLLLISAVDRFAVVYDGGDAKVCREILAKLSPPASNPEETR